MKYSWAGDKQQVKKLLVTVLSFTVQLFLHCTEASLAPCTSVKSQRRHQKKELLPRDIYRSKSASSWGNRVMKRLGGRGTATEFLGNALQ